MRPRLTDDEIGEAVLRREAAASGAGASVDDSVHGGAPAPQILRQSFRLDDAVRSLGDGDANPSNGDANPSNGDANENR